MFLIDQKLVSFTLNLANRLHHAENLYSASHLILILCFLTVVVLINSVYLVFNRKIFSHYDRHHYDLVSHDENYRKIENLSLFVRVWDYIETKAI